MATRLSRSQVPVELTWNLADLFATKEAWEKEMAAVEADVSTVTKYQGQLGQSASVLLACLEAHEKLSLRLTRVMTFASLRSSEDGSDAEKQSDSERLSGVMARIHAALSFIDSEILALPDGTIERYGQEEAGLGDFHKHLQELLERKPYQLSPDTERLLAALGPVFGAPYMIYSRAKASDMTFAPITDSQGQEHPMSLALYEDHYEQLPDTELRHKAYDSFTEGLKRYQNTFAAGYSAEVRRQITMAKARGYESVTDMLLQPQQVTKEMYNRQLDIIQAELAPHMRRLAKVRQQVLGLSKMKHCDLKVPLDADYAPKTTIAEAGQVIVDALSVLGPEYRQVIETALANRWVDYADNIGKSTGAFCSSPYGVHPYILITWTDTMRGAFVLAHELGHAGHFSFAQRHQRLVNTRPSMYFIEAPSTLNELLLAQHLFAQTNDRRMRRWIALQSLGTYYHNFVTHLLEAELQRRVYALAEEGKAITAKVLSEQKGELLERFWGDAAEIDDGARLTWMRQPHYYMGLYPYTYSAGLTISTAVALNIREQGQPAVDRWLQALSAGGTLRPLDLIALAGVDMSTADPIKKAVAYVGTLVDEVEKGFA
ncbi:MAG: oligoendopeptidase F [Firmicutes bacterium]|nr:oligoendopeptidase F [Bacillota bacterium]